MKICKQGIRDHWTSTRRSAQPLVCIIQHLKHRSIKVQMNQIVKKLNTTNFNKGDVLTILSNTLYSRCTQNLLYTHSVHVFVFHQCIQNHFLALVRCRLCTCRSLQLDQAHARNATLFLKIIYILRASTTNNNNTFRCLHTAHFGATA